MTGAGLDCLAASASNYKFPNLPTTPTFNLKAVDCNTPLDITICKVMVVPGILANTKKCFRKVTASRNNCCIASMYSDHTCMAKGIVTTTTTTTTTTTPATTTQESI